MKVTDGYVITSDNGQPYATVGYSLSEFIDVVAGNTVCFSLNGVATTVLRVCAYTDKKIFISASANNINSYTIPTNAKYIRFCVSTTNAHLNLQCEYHKVTTFEAYTSYEKIKTKHIDDFEVFLPSAITCVVGREMNIYFKNIVNCKDVKSFDIMCASACGGINYGDRYSINALVGKIGSYLLTINFMKNGEIIKSANTTINIVADSKTTIKKSMFIGDSWTNYGVYIAELKYMLGTNLTWYGNNTTNVTLHDTVFSTKHEGRNGWGLYDYIYTTSYNGSTNAFLNSGTFDFSFYMSNNTAYSDLTDVYIFLGINDYGRDANLLKTYAQSIINSIHAYNSNIIVHVCIPPQMSTDERAYGIYVGTTQSGLTAHGRSNKNV